MMYSLSTVAALATLLSTILAVTPDTVPGFTVTWFDNFPAGIAVDTTKWAFWNGAPPNGEQETYPGPGINCQITGTSSLLIAPENTNGQ
jgi:hypothetical protein